MLEQLKLPFMEGQSTFGCVHLIVSPALSCGVSSITMLVIYFFMIGCLCVVPATPGT